MSFETQQIVDGIKRWATCESPSSDAGAVNTMMDLATEDLSCEQIDLERISGRDGMGDVLIARAGPRDGQPHTLILSHLDTVHPVGTLERDLPIRVEGDRLYGPGVLDMKGGAFIGLTAFKTAAREGRLKRPTIYMFTPDEEVGSVTTRPLIEAQAKGAAHVLLTEPAREGGKTVTARRGSARYDVFVKGIPSHSGAAPEAGRSAIREAARQILDIDAQNDHAAGVSVNIGLIKGGSAANTIPEDCWFKVDIRINRAEDAARLNAFMHALKPHDPDVKIVVKGQVNRPPYSKNDAIAGLLAQVLPIGADLGLDLSDVPLSGGGSDGNFTAAMGVPTLDGLGIEGSGAHTLEEHALISSIKPRTRLFYRLLTEL